MIPKDAKKPLEDLFQAFVNDDFTAVYEATEALGPIVEREQEKALRKMGIIEKPLAERVAKHNKKKGKNVKS